MELPDPDAEELAVRREAFAAAFSYFESLAVTVVDSGPGHAATTYRYDLETPPPRTLPCCNKQCMGGVLYVWMLLTEMVRSHQSDLDLIQPCSGAVHENRTTSHICGTVFHVTVRAVYKRFEL